MSNALARDLRWICKHDSFTAEGCTTCAAADEVEKVAALRAEIAKLRQGEPAPAFWRYRWTLNNQPRPDEIRPNTAPPINIIGYSFPPEPLYASPPPAQPTQAESVSPAEAEAGPVWRELAQRCLRSMKDAVHWETTKTGRPPSQTCLFEIEELEAMLAASPQEAQPVQPLNDEDINAELAKWNYAPGADDFYRLSAPKQIEQAFKDGARAIERLITERMSAGGTK